MPKSFLMTHKRYEPIIMTPVATSEMDEVDVVSNDPPFDHIRSQEAQETEDSQPETEEDIVVDDEDDRVPPIKPAPLDLRTDVKLASYHKEVPLLHPLAGRTSAMLPLFVPPHCALPYDFRTHYLSHPLLRYDLPLPHTAMPTSPHSHPLFSRHHPLPPPPPLLTTHTHPPTTPPRAATTSSSTASTTSDHDTTNNETQGGDLGYYSASPSCSPQSSPDIKRLDQTLNRLVEKAWHDVSSAAAAAVAGADVYCCPECGKRYSTSSNLARHRQIHRSVNDKKARKCPHCDKVYVSMPAYSMHVRTHNQGCECRYCGKRFSRPWLLQGHVRTHTGEKPFKCPKCSKAFADKSNLRAHIQTHSSEKPYVCGRCGKAFALKSYLYKHEESSCMRGSRFHGVARQLDMINM